MNALSDLDEDARQRQFLALFLPQQPMVRAFLRSIVWDGQRCEDVFQETALVLWREFHRYDATRPFGPWARGVAGKVALNAVRQARRAPISFSPDAVQALESVFAAEEVEHADWNAFQLRQEALRHCLERLPEKTRVLVRLRYEVRSRSTRSRRG